jgi:hypothetical protein
MKGFCRRARLPEILLAPVNGFLETTTVGECGRLLERDDGVYGFSGLGALADGNGSGDGTPRRSRDGGAA